MIRKRISRPLSQDRRRGKELCAPTSLKRLHLRARSGEADSAVVADPSRSPGRVAVVNARPRLRDGRGRPGLTTQATHVTAQRQDLADILGDPGLRFVAGLLMRGARDSGDSIAAPLDVGFRAALRRRLMLMAEQLRVRGINDSEDL